VTCRKIVASAHGRSRVRRAGRWRLADAGGREARAGSRAARDLRILTAIGFFRSNSLDGLSELSSIPVANLLFILVGTPLLAVLLGWLLAGRAPAGLGRQPLE
jgi:hypothetical protein